MADTPDQVTYDQELSAIKAIENVAERQAATLKFQEKYPSGRPKSAPTSDIKEKLGLVAALLLDPKYGASADPFIQQVYDLFQTEPLKAAEIFKNKTKFGRLNPTAQVRYISQLENSDVFKQSLEDWKVVIRKNLKSQGIPFTEQQLDDYYLRGIPETTIQDELIKSTKFEPGKTGGNAQENYNNLLKIAKRNGVSESSLAKVLGFDTIDQAIDELATGQSMNVFEQKIRNYAKTAMPDNVKNLIDQGYDLMDVIGPYQSTIADELEIPYSTIDVTNKYVQDALSQNMNLSELRRILRKDNQWQYTDKARSEVADVLLTVKRSLGFAG